MSDYEADIRSDCADFGAAERKILFAIATARAKGVHLVRVRHDAAQAARLRRVWRSWREERLISVAVNGGELRDDDLASAYLSEMYPAVLEDDDFTDGNPGVTFLVL